MNPAALWLMKTWTFKWKLRDKELKLNADLYLKGVIVLLGLQPLAPRLPELLSELERLDSGKSCIAFQRLDDYGLVRIYNAMKWNHFDKITRHIEIFFFEMHRVQLK